MPAIEIATLVLVALPYGYALLDVLSCGQLSKASEMYTKLDDIERKIDDIKRNMNSVVPYNNVYPK